MPVASASPFSDDDPDWESVVELFFRSVQLRPDNLSYRQSLRGAEFRLKMRISESVSFWTKWDIKRFDSKLATLDRQNKWDDLDVCAEEAIRLDPWDPIANMFAAKACVQRGYYEVGRFLLECALLERLKSDSYPQHLFEQMKSWDLEEVDWPGVLKIAMELRSDRWR